VANPLPNEKELYERIRLEHIAVPLDVWDLLYNHIGDSLTELVLLCQYYLKTDQPIPIDEARKILRCCRHIKDINNKITVSSTKDSYFPEIGEGRPLHPVIREMLTHYIGNDLYMIILSVQDSIDPLDPQPISQELTQKILNRAKSIKEFMERLRIATTQAGLAKEEPKNNKNLSKDEILRRIRGALSQEFKVGESAIQPSCRFREDLGFDSIDGLRVVMVLEDEFGLEIPDDAPDKILTVSQAVDYIFKEISRL
jgi:acyl carrier protein